MKTNKDQGKHFGHHKGSGKGGVKQIAPRPDMYAPGNGPPSGGSAGGGSGPKPTGSGGGLGGPGGGQGGGGCGCGPPPATPPMTPGFNAQAVQKLPTLLGMGILEIPDLGCFYPFTADFNNNTETLPNYLSNVNILVTGSPLMGMRNRNATAAAYTHLALIDPNLAIFDDYASGAYGANCFVAMPAGQTLNWWRLSFGGIAVIPGLGKRRVLFMDRELLPGSYPTLI